MGSSSMENNEILSNENDLTSKNESQESLDILRSWSSISNPGMNDEHVIEYLDDFLSNHKQSAQVLFEKIEAVASTNQDYACILGFLYHKGFGTNTNLRLAFDWYFVAAKNHDSFAQNQFGWLYAKGYGTERDNDKAFYWYAESAKQGHTSGMSNYGFCYETEIGTRKDLKKAFYWYKRSADLGDELGQCNAGNCYLLGDATNRDVHAAILMFLKAKNSGACYIMDNLHYLF
ncbi:hypothetical protein G9A89_019628 [Geosiphon pyriformis]|nr:hypothetical protein G9A89_019628 [Geosiphon pyriformis]